MKVLLLFTFLFAGCVSSKRNTLTNPTWKDGFISNIEIDTLNVIRLQRGLLYPIGRIDMAIDSTCKHPITQTTLAYCPDGGCNTVSCFSCGKKLYKQ